VLETICKKGTIFTGSYDGAYTAYMSNIEQSIILYGSSYTDPFTFVHEFGHYMNDDYNKAVLYKNSTVTQSYDLDETHSQGMEALYLSYLKTQSSSDTYNALKLSKLYDEINNILKYMAVNVFEEAIYTDTYTGTGASKIMADGKVTKDEYDELFKNIISDFGLSSSDATYWRYVTITQPCYYTSYSLSGLGAMQLYIKAQNSSLDTATQSYTKLITYTDEHPEYTYSEVLTNAGLYDYKDEELYKYLKSYFESL
jgi:hypothetical protein